MTDGQSEVRSAPYLEQVLRGGAIDNQRFPHFQGPKGTHTLCLFVLTWMNVMSSSMYIL